MGSTSIGLSGPVVDPALGLAGGLHQQRRPQDLSVVGADTPRIGLADLEGRPVVGGDHDQGVVVGPSSSEAGQQDPTITSALRACSRWRWRPVSAANSVFQAYWAYWSRPSAMNGAS